MERVCEVCGETLISTGECVRCQLVGATDGTGFEADNIIRKDRESLIGMITTLVEENLKRLYGRTCNLMADRIEELDMSCVLAGQTKEWAEDIMKEGMQECTCNLNDTVATQLNMYEQSLKQSVRVKWVKRPESGLNIDLTYADKFLDYFR